jgi:alkaline phosphatase
VISEPFLDGNADSEKRWIMMSEAASIDKQMHTLDYDRALGELLELDDTIKATIEHLKANGQLHETQIIVTADHGHGFDVMGSVDTKYLSSQEDDRKKRGAIGTYAESGLSQYTVADSAHKNDSSMVFTDRAHFPANWDPRLVPPIPVAESR